MKRVLLGLGVLVVLGGLWLLFVRAGERGPVRARGAPDPAALPERVVAELDQAPAARRTEVAGSEAQADSESGAGEEAPPAEPAASSVLVRGRVLDAAGEGLAGVPIVKTGSWLGLPERTELAVSGSGGRFEAELALGRESVKLQCKPDSGFATLRAAKLERASAAREHVLVAAPEIELGGAVVAARGGPLAAASLRFEVPIAAFTGFPVPLDGTVGAPVEEKTGADGRFARLRVPAVAGATLTAGAKGFRARTLEAPLEPRADLWIELEALAPGEPWLRGIVLHADGSAAKGAAVRLGSMATKSADDGSFELEKDWAFPETPLVAALRGFQPAILPRAGELLELEFAPAPVRLVLGGPTLAIAGSILDAEGEPCRGWKVGVHDGTILTPSCVPFDLAEDLARGKKIATASDAEGAFELQGLSERDYVVEAFDEDTLLLVRSEPVPAGTRDLELRVPASAYHARLAGRVVGRDARPVAGARVSSRLVTARNGGAVSYLNGPEASTDESGAFELENVPRRHVELDVAGDLVIPATFELDEAPGPDLRLEVARRCHLRVELAPGEAEAPDALSALDGEGNALSLFTFQGNGWSSSTRLQLSRLGTHPLGVSEDARTLVFYRESSEQRRAPIELVPGELSVVKGGSAAR